MDIREEELLRLSPVASEALSRSFADGERPCLRIFLSFLSDSGPRLELSLSQPESAKRLLDAAQGDVEARWRLYQYLAAMPGNGGADKPAQAE